MECQLEPHKIDFLLKERGKWIEECRSAKKLIVNCITISFSVIIILVTTINSSISSLSTNIVDRVLIDNNNFQLKKITENTVKISEDIRNLNHFKNSYYIEKKGSFHVINTGVPEPASQFHNIALKLTNDIANINSSLSELEVDLRILSSNNGRFNEAMKSNQSAGLIKHIAHSYAMLPWCALAVMILLIYLTYSYFRARFIVKFIEQTLFKSGYYNLLKDCQDNSGLSTLKLFG